MSSLPDKLAIIIDDEAHVRTLMNTVLHSIGFKVVAQLPNADNAAEKVSNSGATLVTLDMNLLGTSGLDLLKQILATNNVCVVILSSVNNPTVIQECLDAGASHYLLKNSSIQQMKDNITRAWERFYSEKDDNSV